MEKKGRIFSKKPKSFLFKNRAIVQFRCPEWFFFLEIPVGALEDLRTERESGRERQIGSSDWATPGKTGRASKCGENTASLRGSKTCEERAERWEDGIVKKRRKVISSGGVRKGGWGKRRGTHSHHVLGGTGASD